MFKAYNFKPQKIVYFCSFKQKIYTKFALKSFIFCKINTLAKLIQLII